MESAISRAPRPEHLFDRLTEQANFLLAQRKYHAFGSCVSLFFSFLFVCYGPVMVVRAEPQMFSELPGEQDRCKFKSFSILVWNVSL